MNMYKCDKVNNLDIKGIFMIGVMITTGDGKVKFETDSFPSLNILPISSFKKKPFWSHPLLFIYFWKQLHLFPFFPLYCKKFLA